MNQKYGAGTFTLHMTDSYYNMKEKLTDHMYLIHNAEAAMQKAGVTPKIVAIRGGTDGARLSYEGPPAPTSPPAVSISTPSTNLSPSVRWKRWSKFSGTLSPCKSTKIFPLPLLSGNSRGNFYVSLFFITLNHAPERFCGVKATGSTATKGQAPLQENSEHRRMPAAVLFHSCSAPPRQ